MRARAHNDNEAAHSDEALLRASLRHFAEHLLPGVGAVRSR